MKSTCIIKPVADPRLTGSMGFFSTSAANTVISTVKKAEDDDRIIMLIYGSR